MFVNSRSQKKAGELRAYASEDEAAARSRLEAAGWDFGSVDFEFENNVFTIKKVKPDDSDESDES